jgi:hypothetical protein
MPLNQNKTKMKLKSKQTLNTNNNKINKIDDLSLLFPFHFLIHKYIAKSLTCYCYFLLFLIQLIIIYLNYCMYAKVIILIKLYKFRL